MRRINKSRLVYLTLLTVIMIGGIYVFINEDSLDKSSYFKKKMTIEQIENSNPVTFLIASGGLYNKSFWGTKIKINGEIKNRATVANYKDAKIRVTYYSKTKTVLAQRDYMIYEIFPPNTTVKFKLKIENYKNVESIRLEVIKASVYKL